MILNEKADSDFVDAWDFGFDITPDDCTAGRLEPRVSASVHPWLGRCHLGGLLTRRPILSPRDRDR